MYKKLAFKYNYKYYQIYFEKPNFDKLSEYHKKCKSKNISKSNLINIWKKYYKFNIDITYSKDNIKSIIDK